MKTIRMVLSVVLAIAAIVVTGQALGAHTVIVNGEHLPLMMGAVIGANVLTLADWAKRLDANGKVPDIVEMLNQTNEVLMDMHWVEGNLPTGHRTTVRTGLPAVAWRLLNNGVAPSKSTTAQIDEQCGMLEAWSEVDVELADLNGNTEEFRLSEAMAFIEAMNQEMVQTLFYGNGGTSPEEFTGLSVRYSSLSAGNGRNIIDAGGTGSDNTSVWLVVWGNSTVHGIFPKGSKAGLTHNNLGEETVEVTNGIAGNRMRAYRDQWVWKCGIALRDWRYVVRIANIDVSNLVANSGSQADLITLMIKATYRIINRGLGKPVFYVNRTVGEFLDIQTRSAVSNGGQLSYQVVDGNPVLSFRGIPIRLVDQLLLTEARVV